MHLVLCAKCLHTHSTSCSQLDTLVLLPGYESIMATSLLSPTKIANNKVFECLDASPENVPGEQIFNWV